MGLLFVMFQPRLRSFSIFCSRAERCILYTFHDRRAGKWHYFTLWKRVRTKTRLLCKFVGLLASYDNRKVKSACLVNEIKQDWTAMSKVGASEAAASRTLNAFIHMFIQCSYTLVNQHFFCWTSLVASAVPFFCLCSGIQSSAGCTSVSMVPRGSPCNAVLKLKCEDFQQRSPVTCHHRFGLKLCFTKSRCKAMRFLWT